MADSDRRSPLHEQGLWTIPGPGVAGRLRFERPAWIQGHRLKDCTVGAFTFFNSAGHTSAYRVHFGRYSQIGESSVLGPPEHPADWFSSHPFAFTRPRYLPDMYAMPEFARLAPDADTPQQDFVETRPQDTWIGHEAYIGANSFVKRGVRIGAGALVGAHSVVTHDIPAYAIAVGSPARVIRLRFSEDIVERFLALKWWLYDLAPHKQAVDFSRVEPTLDYFEQALAEGRLQRLVPPVAEMRRGEDGRYVVQPCASLMFD
jgi:acetyltransferase-like isoleucine patch superfamily enzyme